LIVAYFDFSAVICLTEKDTELTQKLSF